MLNLAEHEFFLLINVKMPTIAGILTFKNRMNLRVLKQKKNLDFSAFWFYEQKFHAQLR